MNSFVIAKFYTICKALFVALLAASKVKEDY